MIICWTSDRLFSFYDGKETARDFGEATFVEVVASLLVMSDFVPLCNCKLVDEISWLIPKISDSNNFITVLVLCWWAERRLDIIFGMKIGSLAAPFLNHMSQKSNIVFQNCFCVGTSALTSDLFQSLWTVCCPNRKYFWSIWLSKTIVLFSTAVKLSL